MYFAYDFTRIIYQENKYSANGNITPNMSLRLYSSSYIVYFLKMVAVLCYHQRKNGSIWISQMVYCTKNISLKPLLLLSLRLKKSTIEKHYSF